MKWGMLLASFLLLPAFAAAGKPGLMLAAVTSAGHGTTLSWTDSTSLASCSSAATPPCAFGYNVYRGTTAGGEDATPINSFVLGGTTYFDPVTISNVPQTFYYFVEAVETIDGITVNSDPSNEVSVTFPGKPAAPTNTKAAKS